MVTGVFLPPRYKFDDSVFLLVVSTVLLTIFVGDPSYGSILFPLPLAWLLLIAQAALCLGRKPTKVIPFFLLAQRMEQFRGRAYRVFSNYKRLRLANIWDGRESDPGRSNRWP